MTTESLRVVALISGGKDSCYNMIQCVSEGHKIVALANLRPKDKDELDSYMFQTVGHHLIDLYSQAMGVPLYRRTLEGSSVVTDADYTETQDDEVEDLYELLKDVKEKEGINAVSVGAILSDYQRVRVENVCSRLGLVPLGFLWRRPQRELLAEMISSGVQAILIKVAALGLDPRKHLGKTIAQIEPLMHDLESQFGLNVCGEGGEYETFTLDCPLFHKKIVVDKEELVMHSDDPVAPVGYLNLLEAHLEDKPVVNTEAYIQTLVIKKSSNLMLELFSKEDVAEALLQSDNNVPTNTPRTPAAGPLKASPEQRIHFSTGPFGNFWVSGVRGIVKDGQSIGVIAKEAMDALADYLRSQNLTMRNLVVVHLYVRNMDEFAQINNVYKTYFKLNPPARVCVEASLPEGVALSIDCVGCKSTVASEDRQVERRTMHVQGLSHWAPANIGPYSQAQRVGRMVYVAGQIGMVPATLSLIAGLRPQCRLSLRHVSRILDAMDRPMTLTDIILVVCYVTDTTFEAVARAELDKALLECPKPVEEAQGDELTKVAPLVEYVVVPRLPKGALVEWQVYSAICEDLVSGQIEKQAGSLYADLNYRFIPRPDNLLSFTITIEREEDSASQDLAKDALSLALDTLGVAHYQLLGNEVTETTQLPFRTVRIFYHQGVLTDGRLQQVWDNLPCQRFACPPAAFIPVIGFPDERTIMTWCS